MRLQYILLIAIVFAFNFVNAAKAVSIKTVVIDAGHGGKDPGASSKSGKIHEKDVALSVALKLGSYIEKNFPDVNVIYTRKTDVFLELHERAEIANKARADLFIAIHCNASTNNEIYGTSTYVLGLHRTEANLEVAKRENSVILMEDDREKNYEFDPNTPEGHIIMSMKQNAFLDQSIDFASKTEYQFGKYSKRKSLGVKQAGFYVLYKTAMPSLLCEIGFISNPEEEKFLTSAKGQELVATGLANAFGGYKEQMEGLTAGARIEVEETKPATTSTPEPEKKSPVVEAEKEEPAVETKPAATIPTPEPAAPAKTEPPKASTASTTKIRIPIENSSGGGIAKTTTTIAAAEPKKKPEVKPEPKAAEPVAEKPKPATTAEVEQKKKPEVKPEPKTAEPVAEKPKPTTTAEAEPKKKPEVKPEPKAAEPVAEKPKPTTTAEAEPKKKPEVKPEPKAAEPVVVKAKTTPPAQEATTGGTTSVPAHIAESGTVYKVQLFALKGDMKEKEYAKVTKLFEVLSAEELSNGFTRYYAGNLKSFLGAKKLLTIALDNGFTAAFVVGFKDGKRLSADQIIALDK